MDNSEHITIRAAQPADIAAVRAINAAGQPGVAALGAAELARLTAGAIRCWVAVAEAPGAVAGYLIAYTSDAIYDGEEFAWFQSQYQRFLYVDQIASAPDQRRAGIGAALYRTASAYARDHGLSALTCEVNLEPANPISLSFHRAQGFEKVGTLAVGDGRTVALLHLKLALAR